MKAKEFDRIFDENREDITQYLNLSNIKRPNLELKRINIDFPAWMRKKLYNKSKKI